MPQTHRCYSVAKLHAVSLPGRPFPHFQSCASDLREDVFVPRTGCAASPQQEAAPIMHERNATQTRSGMIISFCNVRIGNGQRHAQFRDQDLGRGSLSRAVNIDRRACAHLSADVATRLSRSARAIVLDKPQAPIASSSEQAAGLRGNVPAHRRSRCGLVAARELMVFDDSRTRTKEENVRFLSTSVGNRADNLAGSGRLRGISPLREIGLNAPAESPLSWGFFSHADARERGRSVARSRLFDGDALGGLRPFDQPPLERLGRGVFPRTADLARLFEATREVVTTSGRSVLHDGPCVFGHSLLLHKRARRRPSSISRGRSIAPGRFRRAARPFRPDRRADRAFRPRQR